MKKQHGIDTREQFEIRDPVWALWACIALTVGCLLTFYLFLYLESRGVIGGDALGFGCIFLALAFVSAVGVYAWIYQRLTLSYGVYKYYNPFGKNQTACVGEIDRVKILTAYFYTHRGIRKKIRIFFYDKHKNVLIKIIDDGTVSKNAAFLKSLKYHRIKLIREEKQKY